VWESAAGWLFGALVVACAVAGWLAVALVRARRLHRAGLEQRGRLLERERESAVRGAVEAERSRIARELHDIVSHNVSLMVVQAAAARDVLSAVPVTLPGEVEAALEAVEGAGRDTMTELRHLLGLLAPSQSGDDEPYGADLHGVDRHGADPYGAGAYGVDSYGAGAREAELSPQPSLGRLSSLIDRISFAGLAVDVRISGEPRPLPAGVEVTAYRIVQEALTNVLKHADGATKAQVTIRYADRSLRVEVLNTGPSALTGGSAKPEEPEREAPARGPGTTAKDAERGDRRGLIGLRERVAVYGGDLDARRRLGGGYRVRARIPLDRRGRQGI
jgi:signal transduction histidine kinase